MARKGSTHLVCRSTVQVSQRRIPTIFVCVWTMALTLCLHPSFVSLKMFESFEYSCKKRTHLMSKSSLRSNLKKVSTISKSSVKCQSVVWCLVATWVCKFHCNMFRSFKSAVSRSATLVANRLYSHFRCEFPCRKTHVHSVPKLKSCLTLSCMAPMQPCFPEYLLMEYIQCNLCLQWHGCK